MRNITKILSLTLLLLISCNESQKSKQTDKKQVNNDLKFKNSYLNSPKLFSKFWIDMAERDFHRVIDSLKNERKIIQKSDSLIYKLDGYEMYLTNKFENGKLKKITLLSPIQPLGDFAFNQEYSPYNLYKEKYKLQDLKKEYKYYNYDTHPNKDFRLTQYIYLTNGLTENVHNSLIDTKPKKYKYEKSKAILKIQETERFSLPQEKFVISKGQNINIIIEESPSVSDIDFIYSLEDLQNAIPPEIILKYGINDVNLLGSEYKSFNDQKDLETIGDYLIRKNSKYITAYFYQKYNLKVTYATKDYFEKEQNRLIQKGVEEKNLREKIKDLNKKEQEKKRKNALEDI